MITLKDIKVSKNPIPVQNALWVRPLGGLKFKVFYPAGGNWTEINMSGSSPSPTPGDLESRVAALELGLANLKKTVNSYRLEEQANMETIGERFVKDETKIRQLELSVERLYGSTDITTLLLTKLFPASDVGVEIPDPAVYGIDTIYLNAIRKGTVNEFVSGSDRYPATYEHNSWSPYNGLIVTKLILNGLRETQTTIDTLRWITQIQSRGGSPLPPVTYYFASRHSYARTLNTVLLPNFYKELFLDVSLTPHTFDIFPTQEEMQEYGFTLEMLEHLGSIEGGQAFLGTEALPYTLNGMVEEGEENYRYYTITMVCVDRDYNAQKIFRISVSVVGEEYVEGECDIFYEEELIPEGE